MKIKVLVDVNQGASGCSNWIPFGVPTLSIIPYLGADPQVILISLKAGGEGLNLQVPRIFLIGCMLWC